MRPLRKTAPRPPKECTRLELLDALSKQLLAAGNEAGARVASLAAMALGGAEPTTGWPTDPCEVAARRSPLICAATNLAAGLYGAPEASTMVGLLTGQRVIICGAGPSLDAALPYLKQLSEHYVIIAVGTAARRVSEFVRPDIVMVVDDKASMAHLEGVHAELVVLSWFCHPTVWQGASAVGQRIGLISNRTGVSADAAGLALAWGASEVVLVGVDLAFPPTGPSYARGTVHEDATAEDFAGAPSFLAGRLAPRGERPAVAQAPLSPVRSVDGRPLVSFQAFREQVAELSRIASLSSHARLINASNGAAIDGWSHASVESLLTHGASVVRPLLDRVGAAVMAATREHIERHVEFMRTTERETLRRWQCVEARDPLGLLNAKATLHWEVPGLPRPQMPPREAANVAREVLAILER